MDNRKLVGKERSIFSFRSSYRYNSNLKVTEIRAVDDIKNNRYGASHASDIYERIEEDYRRLLGKYNDYLEKEDVRPSEAREHIIGELNSAITNCLDLQISSLGNVEGNKGTLYFKKEDSDIEFEYNVLSSGEKEVIDILLDLYLRKDEYNDSIYIIDEPELHINTSIQRSLLIEIHKMVPDNCQIWIATHSIGFLRALQEELRDASQIIYFDHNNRWASEDYTLVPSSFSRNEWKKVFSSALEDLSELICPKTIVYCEGKDILGPDGEDNGTDAYIYNTIFNKEYPDVLFISSGGNTELDQRSDIALMILSKVFSSLDIFVLKDRDMASGKIISEADRQIYLSNNPANHRVLKRFELENYLYDKDILKKYCSANGLSFDEDTYDNKISNIYDDNVKDSTGLIKNICGIQTSINKEVFKRNLASFITEDTEVYRELKDVIFDKK